MTGLSSATFWRRVHDGSIPIWQPGGRRTRVLIPIEALQTGRMPGATPIPAAAQAAQPAPLQRHGPAPRWLRDHTAR